MDRNDDGRARAPGGTAVAVAIALATCAAVGWAAMPESRGHREERIRTDLDAGRTVEVAHGTDGAKLWAVERDGRVIYFSKGAVALDDQGPGEGS